MRRLLSAEEFVDGDAEFLADDVVEGDVDGRDCAGDAAATLEVLPSIHLLPYPTAPHRVLADEPLPEMVYHSANGEFAAGEAGFSPTVDAFVGLDLYEHLVSVPDPYRVVLDVGDFHRGNRVDGCWVPAFAGMTLGGTTNSCAIHPAGAGAEPPRT